MAATDASRSGLDMASNVSQGHDNASDARIEYRTWHSNPSLLSAPTTLLSGTTANTQSADTATVEDSSTASSETEGLAYGFPPAPKTRHPAGFTTFAYQHASNNRLPGSDFEVDGKLDTKKYTPCFIHDCMMLPGSLANLLGKESSKDVTPRMTPALLHGYYAHVNRETHQPCLLQSPDMSDCVQGMLVLGQGRNNRRLIHDHYADTRRMKVKVEIEVLRPVPFFDRRSIGERWRRERKAIWAHAWLWSDVSSPDLCFRHEVPMWTLEDYVSGTIRTENGSSLRIRNDWKLTDEEDENLEEEPAREIVYAGSGMLEYERLDKWAGW